METEENTQSKSPQMKLEEKSSDADKDSELGIQLYTIIFILLIILGVILFIAFLFFIIDRIYPKVKSVTVQGSSNSGQSGNSGHDGILYPFATNGDIGKDGLQGKDGLIGLNGGSGPNGDNGNDGEVGFQGTPGKVGKSGNPSNSVIPILNRYDLQKTDSYTFRDSFSWEGIKYEVSYYTNIENNTRFILDGGETIEVTSDPNDITKLHPGLSYPNNLTPSTSELQDLAGGTFLSNLRIAIGYGRGKNDSKNRSDDTIFYISPPISRRSYLFRYKFKKGVIPDEFKRVNIDYPVVPLGNSKEFYYFKSIPETSGALSSKASIFNYHLLRGIGRYEIVVNTYPQLPDNVKFNYRIIEEFTAEEGLEFNLPKVTFPFNSTNLVYRDLNSLRTVTISNRFDLNKVVERNLVFDKVTWKQTDKTVVEISNPERKLLTPYENTYSSLENEHSKSLTELDNSTYYGNTGENVMENLMPPIDLKLFVDMKIQGVELKNQVFYAAIRSYVPPVPLNKFRNSQKLYLKFYLIPSINCVPNQDFVYQEKNIVNVTYGDVYRFDLIDFKTLYSKSIGFPKYYQNTTTPNNFGLFPSDSDDANYELDITRPISVGYTEKEKGSRFTTEVMAQNFVDLVYPSGYSVFKPYYFVNIPLYGYKRE